MSAAERLTPAGHDPRAAEILTAALSPHCDRPFSVAVDVFGLLHDAGLRIVADEFVQPDAARTGDDSDP